MTTPTTPIRTPTSDRPVRRTLRIAAIAAAIVASLLVLDEVRMAIVGPGMSERTLKLLLGSPSKSYAGPPFPSTFSPRTRIGCSEETASLQVFSRTWTMRPSLVVALSNEHKVVCSERIFRVSFIQR